MAVADQKRIRCADHDEIMHSEQGDCRSVFIEDDVVTGIDRSEDAIRRVSAFVLFKIIRHCSPASDVVPIETGLNDKNAVCLFHDRVIEGDLRQPVVPLAQNVIEISRRQ